MLLTGTGVGGAYHSREAIALAAAVRLRGLVLAALKLALFQDTLSFIGRRRSRGRRVKAGFLARVEGPVGARGLVAACGLDPGCGARDLGERALVERGRLVGRGLGRGRARARALLERLSQLLAPALFLKARLAVRVDAALGKDVGAGTSWIGRDRSVTEELGAKVHEKAKTGLTYRRRGRPSPS